MRLFNFRKKNLFYIFAIFIVFIFNYQNTFSATLSTSPATISVISGETFNVSVLLDTDDEKINTIDLKINFPPDKLQVANTQTGTSLVSLWTSQPSFDNIKGTIQLQGGVPNGVQTSKGLITTLTFRARGTGQAFIQIDSKSRVLLNDGLGTETRLNTGSSVAKILLPPPDGPMVTSSTNPIGSWSNNNYASFTWSDPAYKTDTAYSFILDQTPTTTPDNTIDSDQNSITYENIEDGEQYFHIKAINNGVWGGVTHYPIKVDNTPPAKFPINVIPSKRTSNTQPVINISTTDNISGIRNYEMALISRETTEADAVAGQPFFFEFSNPYILPKMNPGSYQIIIRAYDNAGNIREEVEKIVILQGFYSFLLTEGLVIKDLITIPWPIIWLILIIIIGALSFKFYKLKKITRQCKIEKNQNTPEIERKIKELESLKNKYKQVQKDLARISIFIIFIISAFSFSETVLAVEKITPPLIYNFSQKISSDELFYMSGKTEKKNSIVTLYIQNESSGDLRSYQTTSDEKGGWLYQSQGLLSSGDYIIWAQTTNGEESSPPSPQYKLSVRQSVVDFGFSKIGFGLIFTIITFILIILIIFFSFKIYIMSVRHSKETKLFLKESKEAEDAVRIGFSELKKHIHTELENIRKKVSSGEMSKEIADQKEAEIIEDLSIIEEKIEKEVWDIRNVVLDNKG